MIAPTTLTITYAGGTATLTLRTPDGTNPESYQQAVKNIYLNGGFWAVIAGVNTFVPSSQISLITAS